MKTAFINKIHGVFDSLLSILFPVHCPYCLSIISSDKAFCRDCSKSMPKTIYKRYAIGGYPCCTPFPYLEHYAAAVKRMKFQNRPDLAKQLALPLAKVIKEYYDISEIDLITSVPMHKKKLNKRKYNQSELLAKECARLLEIKYKTVLTKHKHNLEQHKTKSRKERENNVRGVFRLIDKELVKNKTVLIIDDIITTGCTLGECGRITEKGKARRVLCAALCTSVVGVD